MRRYIILSALVFAALFVNAQAATNNSKLKFNTLEHDFGNQPQGKPVTFEFEFINTDTKDAIVLEDVKASCGCTTPTWTKEPVMPGKKGVIKAQYNMARDGAFRKSITVNTKNGETITLYISGNAVAQKQGVDDAEPTILNGN
jgi:hypothetical protein